jgi:transposase-like protein
MKGKKYSPEQIIRKLREGEALLASGMNVEQVAKQLDIGVSTWHRWRTDYQGMNEAELKRLKGLEEENRRLKKLVADQALDIDMLKEVARGNF